MTMLQLAPRSSARTCPSHCGRVAGVAERSTVKPGTAPQLHSVRVRTGEFQTQSTAKQADREIDDAALARAGMIGQAWSHREIWYRFAPMVYALLRRTLGARHDQEDLLQEVFLRVFRRLSTLQNPAALRSFVYSFAVRIIQEELRRYRMRSRFASMFPGPPAEPSVPAVDFESRELLSRIQVALDGMPDRKRAVFVLRRFDGMELAEIASSLELSLSTVKRDLEQADLHITKSIHRDGRLRAGLEASLFTMGDVEQ
jgi:RNA polymerase sigma factor (sigma-70 family)